MWVEELSRGDVEGEAGLFGFRSRGEGMEREALEASTEGITDGAFVMVARFQAEDLERSGVRRDFSEEALEEGLLRQGAPPAE